jgi:ferredoxin
MATITYQGQTVTCPVGANLRQVLLQNQRTVHNGGAQLINCRGLGTCGTCAVQIVGPVAEANWRDGH